MFSKKLLGGNFGCFNTIGIFLERVRICETPIIHTYERKGKRVIASNVQGTGS